jgi:hypothetical protein
VSEPPFDLDRRAEYSSQLRLTRRCCAAALISVSVAVKIGRLIGWYGGGNSTRSSRPKDVGADEVTASSLCLSKMTETYETFRRCHGRLCNIDQRPP